jgi:aryl-alcohol dehydrogenase-like predicted oxidoreductase
MVLGYGGVTEADAEAAVEAYIEAGGNFIDSARCYGDSEAVLGRVVKRMDARERVFLCSKSQGGRTEDDIGMIREDVEESLRILGTDHIDLCYLLWPPSDMDLLQRILDVYDELKEEGKVRAVGASIGKGSVSDEETNLCRMYIGTGRIDAIQLVYSIGRQKTREIFQMALEGGVGLVARTVLENGFLTGKYPPGTVFPERQGDHRCRWSGETLQRILEVAQDLKKRAVVPHYETLTQVAIRFSMQPEAISSALVGAKTAEQTRQNMATGELPDLPQEILEMLQHEYGDLTEAFNANTPERRWR